MADDSTPFEAAGVTVRLWSKTLHRQSMRSVRLCLIKQKAWSRSRRFPRSVALSGAFSPAANQRTSKCSYGRQPQPVCESDRVCLLVAIMRSVSNETRTNFKRESAVVQSALAILYARTVRLSRSYRDHRARTYRSRTLGVSPASETAVKPRSSSPTASPPCPTLGCTSQPRLTELEARRANRQRRRHRI